MTANHIQKATKFRLQSLEKFWKMEIFDDLLEHTETRKSSCVNATGIPPAAYQVLAMLICPGGGYPVPCPGGVPHPMSGGVPNPRSGGWGVPHPMSGGYPIPCPGGYPIPCSGGYPILCPGGTPSQVWGVPPVPPQPDLGWGTPPTRPGMGYPPT